MRTYKTTMFPVILYGDQTWSTEHSSFVLGKSRVKVSVRRLAILIEVFRGFIQSFQANSFN
jgi:hypothetical protein